MAREITLRAAYAIEMRNCDIEEAFQDVLIVDNRQPPAFSVRLLTLTERYKEQLDDLIRVKVRRWELHRVAIIDRLILRIAAAEMLYFPDIPPVVTINEAIEIAKLYSTNQSWRFVNGILDAIFGDLTHGRIKIDGQQITRNDTFDN